MQIIGLIWLKTLSPGWVGEGWVGGMKIDNKDHVRLADLAKASCNWSWAELAKKSM